MLNEEEYRRLLEDANGIPRRDYITTCVALLFAAITFFFTIFFTVTTPNFFAGTVIFIFGSFITVQLVKIGGGAMITRTEQAREELAQYYEVIGYGSIISVEEQVNYTALQSGTKGTN